MARKPKKKELEFITMKRERSRLLLAIHDNFLGSEESGKKEIGWTGSSSSVLFSDLQQHKFCH